MDNWSVSHRVETIRVQSTTQLLRLRELIFEYSVVLHKVNTFTPAIGPTIAITMQELVHTIAME